MQARSFLVLPLAALFVACGGSASVATQPPKAAQGQAAKEAPLGPNQLRRSDLMATLSKGPGAFLATLDVEPSLVNGRFRGWRIVSLVDPVAWSNVDLKPGDVVLKVNGYPIERPEEAMVPWQSLAIADELHVSYEREGEGRELRYEIIDAPGTPERP